MSKEEEIKLKKKSIVSISNESVMYVGRSLVRDLYTTISGMMGTNRIIRLTSMPTLNMFLNRLRTTLNSFYSYASHTTISLNGPKRLQMISLRGFLRQEG